MWVGVSLALTAWQRKPSKERPVLGKRVRGLDDHRPPADPARRGELEVRAGHGPEEVHRAAWLDK